MDEIIRQLNERFPLLAQLRLQAATSSKPEPFPLFFGLILSAMESASFSPCCFVLPRRGCTAQIASIVFALERFRKNYPDLVRRYCERKFVPGQRVRIHPDEHVFEYEGVWPEKDKYFRLRVMDEDAWRTFPVADILRVEPTERKRPKGKLKTELAVMEKHPLDHLLGVSTFGNQSLFTNGVLLLDHQNSLKDFLNQICLQNSSYLAGMPPLTSLLPFGSISIDDDAGMAKLENWDVKSPDSEPLVAVTSSIEKLAKACQSADPHSKVVVTNGVGLVLKNLQAYDEICKTQNLIMIAQHDEVDKMQDLASRGCRFWWLSEKEILMAGSESTIVKNGGLFEPIFRAATNQAKLKIDPVICDDEVLDEISRNLEGLNAVIKNDENESLKKLAGRLYSLLLQAAGLVQPPSPEERRQFLDRLSDIRKEFERNKMWLDESASGKMPLICDLFERAFSASTKLGGEKGDRLIQILQELDANNKSRMAILARTNNQVEKLHTWMKQNRKEPPVFSPSRAPDTFFDCVISVAWPGSEAFQKFVRRYLAPHIKVIGYRFENRWLGQCQKKIQHLPSLPTLSGEEKVRLLSLGPNIKTFWLKSTKSNKDLHEPELSNSFSIEEFEERIKSVRKGGMATSSEGEETVPAKYISFVGDSFAYFTENHKVPVVTGLITSDKIAQYQIPLHKVDEISVGDYVVLKDGGNKDVIHAIADLMLGEKASKLRQLAGTWKRTLHECFFTPETLHAKVREAGGTLSFATAANWLNDDFRIGPGKKTDLELIARIIGFTEFDGKLDEIWHAIKTIRSAHLSAGMRLKKVLLRKLPEYLEAIKEEGTRINVDDLVTAWVVQVESIGSEFEPYSRLKVNELQWDDTNYLRW